MTRPRLRRPRRLPLPRRPLEWGAFARRRELDEEETHRFAMGRPTRETISLLGARALGVELARCLGLEDAPSGIEAALAAGVPVVAFRTSHSAGELEGATVVLDSLADAVARPR